MDVAITVENLGKRFSQYHSQRPVTIMEAALSGLRRMKPIEKFWALRKISFTVARGEMLGVIGHNGAGKSTLLQLLGGVAAPTEGKIQIHGSIGALLDLGAGMHSDLTGRENIFVMAIAAGLTRHEVLQILDAIINFAELQQFIDNPVRTYSTGMMMRLAFSVAVHTGPEVLLVDEFLSVGDLAFQAKCLNRIAEMKKQGCAIILVSHDVSQVERLCDRALWLKKGQAVVIGEPSVVAGQYTSDMRSQTLQRTPQLPDDLTDANAQLRVNENRFGSLEVQISDVRILPGTSIASGEGLCIEIDYHNPQAIASSIFSVSISHENGQKYLDTSTVDQGINAVCLQESGTLNFLIDRIDLVNGKYFIDVGMYEQDWSYAYDFHWHRYPLIIQSSSTHQGILAPPMRWEIKSSPPPISIPPNESGVPQ